MTVNQNNRLYRLNHFLAKAGLGARRKVETQLILAGRVRINGKIIKDLNTKVSEKDMVCVNEQEIKLPINFQYYILNKPKGFVVTKLSQKKQKTIYLLLTEELQKLNYAGRLDKDSRGLVVLSDDGDFIQNITHASNKVSKYYRVRLNSIPPNISDLICKQGVQVENELLRADSAKIVHNQANSYLELVLKEGRNRQIRKMMRGLGLHIIDLYRYAIGKINIEKLGLKEGQYQLINPKFFFPANDIPMSRIDK